MGRQKERMRESYTEKENQSVRQKEKMREGWKERENERWLNRKRK